MAAVERHLYVGWEHGHEQRRRRPGAKAPRRRVRGSASSAAHASSHTPLTATTPAA